MPVLSQVVGTLKDTPRSNFTAILQQRLSEPERRWTRRELQPKLESATVEGLPSKERRIIQYRTLLAELMSLNHTVAAGDQDVPEVMAKEDDGDWLLKNLSERWVRKLETNAGQGLQRNKQEEGDEQNRRIMSGRAVSEDEWRTLRAKSRKTERLANKKMWAECRAMTLKDWKNSLGYDYTRQIRELLGLQAFHDIQWAELNSRTDTALSLVSKAIGSTEGLVEVADTRLHVLENQAETTDALLDLCRQSMLRVHTRARRLMATDVEGKSERKAEMRRRLEHPKALDYMFEGKTELEAARAVMNSTKRFVENIEEDLERIALATVDAIITLKDARLGLDSQGDCS